jgi:hypothetical protein
MRENQFGFGLDASYRGDITTMPAMFFPDDVDVSHGSTPGLEPVGMAAVCHAHAGRPPTCRRRAQQASPNFQGPGSEPNLAPFLSTVNTPEMSLPKKMSLTPLPAVSALVSPMDLIRHVPFN